MLILKINSRISNPFQSQMDNNFLSAQDTETLERIRKKLKKEADEILQSEEESKKPKSRR